MNILGEPLHWVEVLGLEVCLEDIWRWERRMFLKHSKV
jgi:hypothetical protein